MSTAGYRLKDQYTRVSCVFYTLAMNILKLKTEKTIPLMIASLYEILRNKFNKSCGRSMQDSENHKTLLT